jgi:anti-sigma factor RsiW
VTHLRAKRLLSSLPDGLLARPVERRVRGHVARCARCRTELHALESSAALVRRLPRSLVPLRVSPDGDHRLAALARWDRVLARRVPVGRLTALAAFARLAPLAAALGLALLLGGSGAEAPEEAERNEAFNFVLAGSFGPAPPRTGPAMRVSALAEDRGQVTRAWIHPPFSTFLPPGAR